MSNKFLVFVLLTLAAFVVTTSVDYDYTTTGVGAGSGAWSATIDSGLIPGEAAGIPVTFGAPMAAPTFVQVDALAKQGQTQESNPGGTTVGWANDATSDSGEGYGMYWMFYQSTDTVYQSTDTVTLTTTTAGYESYEWTTTTTILGSDNDLDLPAQNNYRWTADLTDDPTVFDVVGGELRVASWWGDVDNAGLNGGHRHSGTSRNYGEPSAMWSVGDWWDESPGYGNGDGLVDATEIYATDTGSGFAVDHSDGLDAWSENDSGGLDAQANGDGIGFSLAVRDYPGGNRGSIFVSNVTFGGDVFADTAGYPGTDDLGPAGSDDSSSSLRHLYD